MFLKNIEYLYKWSKSDKYTILSYRSKINYTLVHSGIENEKTGKLRPIRTYKAKTAPG